MLLPSSDVLTSAGLGPEGGLLLRSYAPVLRAMLGMIWRFLPLADPRPAELALEAWENEGGPPAP